MLTFFATKILEVPGMVKHINLAHIATVDEHRDTSGVGCAVTLFDRQLLRCEGEEAEQLLRLMRAANMEAMRQG